MILINAREKCPVEAGQTISVAGPVYFSILFLQLLEITFNLLLLSRKLTPKRDYLMKKAANSAAFWSYQRFSGKKNAEGSWLSRSERPDDALFFTIVYYPFIHVRFAAPFHGRIHG